MEGTAIALNGFLEMCTERPVATDLGLCSGAVAEVNRLVMAGLAGPPAKGRTPLTGSPGTMAHHEEVSAAWAALGPE